MIVSLHIYKTAGTSLLNELKTHLSESMFTDYDQDFDALDNYFYNNIYPTGFVTPVVNNIDVIHGHFLIHKWLMKYSITDNIYVTWLRHPLSRLVSHYYFTKEIYNPAYHKKYHWSRFVEENWSLEEYCFYEPHRNFMSRMLCGVPIDAFDFVGVSEFYNEDIKYFFGRYFKNICFVPQHHCLPTTKDNRDPIILDNNFIEKVEKFHCQDMRIYNYALELRNKRIK